MKNERKHDILGILVLGAAGFPGAAALPAQEPSPGTRIVSSALMDAIEEWSSPGGNVETFALDEQPELLEEYAAFAEERSGGRPLAEVFAERLPVTWATISAEAGADGEAPVAAALVARAMSRGDAEYHAWQAELADAGADFAGFLAARHPEVEAVAAELYRSPASRGVGLRDFAEAKGTGGLDEMELQNNEVDPHFTLLRDCSCWTAVSFDDQPGPGWTSQVDQVADVKWDRDRKRKLIQYRVEARGAARQIDYHRESRRNDYGETRKETVHSSGMRVRMTCTDSMLGQASCPWANACQGELVVRAAYASRAYEMHYYWSNNAFVRSLAADFASLTYASPAPAPPVTLMTKGVAALGTSGRGGLEPIAGTFYDGRLTVHAPIGVTLGSQLLNPTIGGIAGLGIHPDGEGEAEYPMRMSWENPSQPILLRPDQTHHFVLASEALAFGDGGGKQSDSRAKVDSAYALVAVTRAYSCLPIAYAPAPRAFWNYHRSPQVPASLIDLPQQVKSFVNPTLQVNLTDVSAVPGQYP